MIPPAVSNRAIRRMPTSPDFDNSFDNNQAGNGRTRADELARVVDNLNAT